MSQQKTLRQADVQQLMRDHDLISKDIGNYANFLIQRQSLIHQVVLDAKGCQN